jgi:hypothetical protein
MTWHTTRALSYLGALTVADQKFVGFPPFILPGTFSQTPAIIQVSLVTFWMELSPQSATDCTNQTPVL